MHAPIPNRISLSVGTGDDGTVTRGEIYRWVAEAYQVFDTLTTAGAGVSRTPLHRLGRSEDDAPDVGDSGPALTYPHRTLNTARPEMRHVWTYDSFTIDMAPYLTWLSDAVHELGVKTRVGRKYRTLDEAVADTKAEILVNCTGTGAAELCDDTNLRAAKGVLLFKDPLPITGALACREFILALRQRELVAGSLYDLGYTSPDVRPDDVARLEQWHSGWLAEFLELVALTLVDMRRAHTRGGYAVIHNYGHGGAGVTLSWGAAHAVCPAVRDAAT